MHHRIHIVAGQSNATGVFGAPRQLAADPVDVEIGFFWRHFSESPGIVHLQPQQVRDAGENPALSTHGFGPEVTFARALHRSLDPSERILVVKRSDDGTSLHEHWRAPDAPGYRSLVDTVHAAEAEVVARGDTCSIDSMLWCQGESDVRRFAAHHGEELRSLIASVRRDLDAPDLIVVISRVNVPAMDEPNRSIVRDAQVAVAEADRRSAWIDTDDLELDAIGLHLRADGLKAVGERAAACVLAMQRAPR